MQPALIKATYNDYSGISHLTDSLSSLSKEIRYRSATNLVKGVAILLSFKFCQLQRKGPTWLSQSEDGSAIFVFRPARKTNLVENVVTLLPVNIRLIPLSGFREEVCKIENVPRGIQGEKSRKRYGKFGKTGFINWSISKSPKGGRNQVSGRDRNTPILL